MQARLLPQFSGSLISLLAMATLSGCGASARPLSGNQAQSDESATFAQTDPAGGSSGAGETRMDPSPIGSTCVLPNGRRTFDQSKSAEARAEVQGCVPDFTSAQLSTAFAAIRDSRSLTSAEQPGFLRRISWLLPDNGCEPRANQAAYWLEQAGYPRPYFARATGNLGLDTPNDVSGKVRWPGHVAPLVRVDDQLIVLDPAVDPTGPLPLSEWLSRITLPGSSSEFALCQEYNLSADCFAATPAPLTPLPLDNLLRAEWLSEKMLGRDPSQTLGECPPWAGCATTDPAADENLPPTLEQVARSVWDPELWAGLPIYVVGNNFIPGVTTVHITGSGIDRFATLQGTLLRRTIIIDEYPAGAYEITAYKGERASLPLKISVD